MQNEELIKVSTLIRKHLAGTITQEEQQELDQWVKASPKHQSLLKKYEQDNFLSTIDKRKDLEESKAAYELFRSKIKPRNRFIQRLREPFTAAASVAVLTLLASGMLFFWMSQSLNSSSHAVAHVQTPVTTDTAAVILITSTGETIAMNQPNGLMKVTEKSIQVGEKSIIDESHTPAEKIVYNTLKIVRGKKFKMQLSDGTLVWINADSEITFPNRFDKNHRKVSIKGEAFFDVTEDKNRPFVVETPKGQISVLGTAFNVHCYQDDVPATTLVRGKIKYSLGNQSVILKPGQQCAVLGNDLTVKEVDTYDYTSWIDELIIFKNRRLEDIMNTLSRLYDTSVSFDSEITKEVRFTGAFKQYEHLEDILTMLEESGVLSIQRKNNQIIIGKHRK
ncbi:MAG: DUF4974 domain-containing protein [Bacteroidia bacterium]|nr:DUF4974 domain-containing protein [Bacteroidia bacterium]